MLNKELLLASGGTSPWENPQISDFGTWGGTSFAVKCTGDSSTGWSGYEVWRAFDKNESTGYFNRQRSAANSLTISLYNPKPVRLTRINVKQAYYGFGTATLNYSDDGNNWTRVQSGIINGENSITHSGFHKYWKFSDLGAFSGGWRNIDVIEIYLYGWEKG